MNTLLAIYQQKVASNEIKDDAVQRHALSFLSNVYDDLVARRHFLPRLFKKQKTKRGVYFWGGVGIGKTFLMDIFFDALPIEKKCRMHFHHFMREVQLQLRQLQGRQNPLEKVADYFSNKAEVLCFDEFFINDIADAMILGRLLEQLFLRGVTLVTTSNIAPDDLYKDGLHRKRFMPAIALLKFHCEVLHIASNKDHRLRALQDAGVYFFPINKVNQKKMQQLFNLYAHHSTEKDKAIHIEDREIQTLKIAHDVVWFDFAVLCHTPRSQLDYLAISEQFLTVFVSDVPVIEPNNITAVTYLIHLVDVFYDNHVQLIILAEDEPVALYPKGKKAFEFQRTLSRLIEMQSEEYILTCIAKRKARFIQSVDDSDRQLLPDE